MIFSAPVSIDEALRSQLLKSILPTSWSSAEIQRRILPDVLERAFFSARTARADYLTETQALVRRLVSPYVDATGAAPAPTAAGQMLNPAEVRSRMQAYLRAIGYEPDAAKRGGLEDLSSDRRVDLIIDTQLKMSAGKARELSNQDPDILDAFPDDELYRQRDSADKRDWRARWNEARAALGEGATTATYATGPGGPFIARKGDPIWVAISRFGLPYPPFDYNSGMWVRDAP